MRWAIGVALLVASMPGAAAACLAEAMANALPPGPAIQLRPDGVRAAWYEDATDRLGHGIMGTTPDALSLRVLLPWDGEDCRVVGAEAGAGHVFEDTTPRLADIDGDGADEVVVVRSSTVAGAQLAIYALRGEALTLVAATPFIGTRHRWLAPAAIADLDGDGMVEIAYVDRPHLARVLRIWRHADGELREVAAAGGFSNHAIGEPVIEGGMRPCAARPEILLRSADRARLLAVTFDGATIAARDLGPASGRAMARAMAACG